MWRKKKKKLNIFEKFTKYFDRIIISAVALVIVLLLGVNFYIEYKKDNIAKNELLNEINNSGEKETSIKDDELLVDQKYNFTDLRVNFSQTEDNTNNWYTIKWYILGGKPEKISVLTCAKSYSDTYDREWYNLNYKWKSEFSFNVRPSFNNLCNIDYKFKFTAGSDEKVVSYTLKETLKQKQALDTYAKVLKDLNIVLKENGYKSVDKWIYWELSYYECYGLLNIEGKNTGICEWIKDWSSSVGLWLNSKWSDVYELKVSELGMSPTPILNYYYIDSIDKKINEENLKVVWNYLVWEKYVYDLRSKKEISDSKTTNLKDYFYDKKNSKIESFDWSEKYNISWAKIEKGFIVQNNYFVMLEWTDKYSYASTQNKLKVYYGKVYPGLSSINLKSFEIWNTRLWASQTPTFDYFKIHWDVLTVTGDGYFGLDTVEFDLKDEKQLKYEANKYKR